MAVVVDHLWKTFQIPHERRTTLFENLTGFLRPNQYETYTVLKDLSFRVEDGESVGIIGDNGSGKSTLLKIIANILKPTRGKVTVDGRMTPFLELGVGFQSDLTARENVDVYATIMGLPRREIRNKMDDIIEFAGLQKFEDTKLKNLSSGMQVRLAFSTAIQTDPDILLVDEVLAVGDMEFQQKCFDVFERYKREGVTILFVSHDLGAVRRFCDKALLLKGGQLVEFGETNRIIDKYIYNSGENPAGDEPGDKSQSSSQAEGGADGEARGDAGGEGKKTRWGNGKVEITGVKLLDKNGRENSNFVFGDPLTVRIFYRANEPVPSPVFGIVFYSQETYCYGTTNEFKGHDAGLISGTGHLDLAINRLPLLAGRFEITVAVASSDYTTAYDWHDRLYSFHVHNPTRELGIFAMDGSWEMVRDEQPL